MLSEKYRCISQLKKQQRKHHFLLAIALLKSWYKAEFSNSFSNIFLLIFVSSGIFKFSCSLFFCCCCCLEQQEYYPWLNEALPASKGHFWNMKKLPSALYAPTKSLLEAPLSSFKYILSFLKDRAVYFSISSA